MTGRFSDSPLTPQKTWEQIRFSLKQVGWFVWLIQQKEIKTYTLSIFNIWGIIHHIIHTISSYVKAQHYWYKTFKWRWDLGGRGWGSNGGRIKNDLQLTNNTWSWNRFKHIVQNPCNVDSVTLLFHYQATKKKQTTQKAELWLRESIALTPGRIWYNKRTLKHCLTERGRGNILQTILLTIWFNTRRGGKKKNTPMMEHQQF